MQLQRRTDVNAGRPCLGHYAADVLPRRARLLIALLLSRGAETPSSVDPSSEVVETRRQAAGGRVAIREAARANSRRASRDATSRAELCPARSFVGSLKPATQ